MHYDQVQRGENSPPREVASEEGVGVLWMRMDSAEVTHTDTAPMISMPCQPPPASRKAVSNSTYCPWRKPKGNVELSCGIEENDSRNALTTRDS